MNQDTTLRSNSRFDNIDVTSRLMNIILEMPLDQQLDLLEKLDETVTTALENTTGPILRIPGG